MTGIYVANVQVKVKVAAYDPIKQAKFTCNNNNREWLTERATLWRIDRPIDLIIIQYFSKLQ